MKKFLPIVLILFLFIFCGIGYYLFTKNNNERVIKIGVSIPLSGDGKIYGDLSKEIINNFFDKVKSSEPFFKYDVSYKDNKYDTDENILVKKKFSSDKTFDWIISVSPEFKNEKEEADGKERFYNDIAIEPGAKEYAESIYPDLLEQGIRKVDFLIVNSKEPIVVLKHIQDLINDKKEIILENTYILNTLEQSVEETFLKIKESRSDVVLVFSDIPTLESFSPTYEKLQIEKPFIGIERSLYFENNELEVDLLKGLNFMVNAYEKEKSKKIGDYWKNAEILQ